MRKRRPPFALVLSTLVAAAALAIVLAGRGSGGQRTTIQPPTVGSGATKSCITTSARALSDDRSAVVITATVRSPVVVTEQASGPNGIATVTRSEVVSARIRVDQPLEIKQQAAARASACANGVSTAAARTAALRAAFRRALTAAHALAAEQAAKSLRALMHRQYPSVAQEAKHQAAARAHRLALAAESTLAAGARAQARTRAGD